MALPNPWTSINIGDEIKYDEQLTDMRANADYLDDNAANVADNGTVDTGQFTGDDSNQDNSANPTAYTGNDNPYYQARDITFHDTDNAPFYISNLSTYYPGLNSGQNTNVDGTRYITVYNPRYAANNVFYYASNYLKN